MKDRREKMGVAANGNYARRLGQGKLPLQNDVKDMRRRKRKNGIRANLVR